MYVCVDDNVFYLSNIMHMFLLVFLLTYDSFCILNGYWNWMKLGEEVFDLSDALICVVIIVERDVFDRSM